MSTEVVQPTPPKIHSLWLNAPADRSVRKAHESVYSHGWLVPSTFGSPNESIRWNVPPSLMKSSMASF
eukprot:6567873-Prymnesium_polylepis.1